MKSDVENLTAKLTALQKPEVFQKFLSDTNGRIIPPADTCKGILRRTYHVLESDVDLCYSVLIKNIDELDIVSKTKQGSKYLRLDKVSINNLTPSKEQQAGPQATTDEQVTPSKPESKPSPASDTQITPQIFIAHGKNRKPVDQLEKFLNSVGLKYKIAVSEANVGRPIGEKIVDLMNECTSAIFIFTADVKVVDDKNEETWWPSQNVIYELGAASFKYGKKIVIFKEDGVDFGSNFSDLGYIKFEKDKLEDKTGDLVQELLAFEFIRVSAT